MSTQDFMSSQIDNAARTEIEIIGTTKYIGTAKVWSVRSLPVWSIFRVSWSWTNTKIDWANGEPNFNKIMDNYASYTYS